MTGIQTWRRYLYEEHLEDRGPEDPGNRLRAALGEVHLQVGAQQKQAIEQLLYTATERGLLGDGGPQDPPTLELLLRIVKLSETITPAELRGMMM